MSETTALPRWECFICYAAATRYVEVHQEVTMVGDCFAQHINTWHTYCHQHAPHGAREIPAALMEV